MHGAACKRCRECYIIIIESLDEIISKDPNAQLIRVRSQLMQADTLLQICFLKDVLTTTNILSLVLQSDHKEFGAIRRAAQSNVNQLIKMQNDKNCPLLKSLNSCNETLKNLDEYEQQNIVSHCTQKK